MLECSSYYSVITELFGKQQTSGTDMSNIETEDLSLDEISELAKTVLKNGCDENNTNALARTVTTAERDGSLSHGLFRVPGYVASLKSGKVSGDAQPKIDNKLASIVTVDGDQNAPLEIEKGLPVAVEAAKNTGVAVVRLINTFHFAALWPETEFLAENGLMGLACTVYKPVVAPAGASTPFFGTNPALSPGLGQIMILLFSIWRHLRLLWATFKLRQEMGMKFRTARAWGRMETF